MARGGRAEGKGGAAGSAASRINRVLGRKFSLVAAFPAASAIARGEGGGGPGVTPRRSEAAEGGGAGNPRHRPKPRSASARLAVACARFRPPPMTRALLVLPVFVAAGCSGAGGAAIPEETVSNTIWQEFCVDPVAGTQTARAYLRFLPDGTFAWSTAGLAPADFRHDGDDRWGLVGRTLVVTWDDAETTQYRLGSSPDEFVGPNPRPCGTEARLERVE